MEDSCNACAVIGERRLGDLAQKLVQRLHLQDLAVKDVAKAAGDGVGRVLQRRPEGKLLGDLQLQAGDLAVGDAAGDDPLEVAEIRCDVEREAVRGNRLRDVDTDRGDLLLLYGRPGHRPNTGALADALREHTEVGAGTDERLFHEANEVDRAEVRAFFAGKIFTTEIEDGITNQLTGPVIRHVPAAIDLVDLRTLRRKKLVTGKDVGACRISSER